MYHKYTIGKIGLWVFVSCSDMFKISLLMLNVKRGCGK